MLVAAIGVYYFYFLREDPQAPTAGQVAKESAGSTAPDADRPPGPPPANVTTALAQEMILTPQTELPGSVISIADSQIAAQTAGKLQWVAEIGEEIREGDVVARIEPTDARFNVSRQASEVEKLRSQHVYRKSVYDRYVGMGRDTGVSETFIDELRTNMQIASADLQKARALLTEARENLARTEIKAPFAGRVVQQLMQVGEYAQPGRGVVRLVDTYNLEITAQIPAAMLFPIKPGTPIQVKGPTGETQALLRTLVPVGDKISRTMELRASLKDTDWLVGTPVKVTVQSALQNQVIAVPRDALVLRINDIYVMAVKDGVAKRISVKVGESEGEMIALIEGDVKPGDEVIIRGAERLRDGQKVKVQPPPGASGAARAAK